MKSGWRGTQVTDEGIGRSGRWSWTLVVWSWSMLASSHSQTKQSPLYKRASVQPGEHGGLVSCRGGFEPHATGGEDGVNRVLVGRVLPWMLLAPTCWVAYR